MDLPPEYTPGEAEAAVEAEQYPPLQLDDLGSTGQYSLRVDPEEPFPAGTEVVIQGLLAKVQFNSLSAKIVRHDVTDGLYVVELLDQPESQVEELKQVKLSREHFLVSRTPSKACPSQCSTPPRSPRSPRNGSPAPPHEKVAIAAARGSPQSKGSGYTRPPKSPSAVSTDGIGARLGFDRGSVVLRGLKAYSRIVHRFPRCLIFLYIVLFILVVVLFWREFELDTDFSAFISADGHASRQRQAYLTALEEKDELKYGRRLEEGSSRPRRSGRQDSEVVLYDGDHALVGRWPVLEQGLPFTPAEEDFPLQNGTASGRRLTGGTPYYLKKSLTVVYAAKDGNAFGEKVLRDMHNFEAQLRLQTAALCDTKKIPANRGAMCEPGVSFDAFVWPTKAETADDGFYMTFDAAGRDYIPMEAVMWYLSQHQSAGQADSRYLQRYFPKAYQAPANLNDVYGSQPTAIRSQFLFWIKVGSSSMSKDQVNEGISQAQDAYRALIEDSLYPFFLHEADKYEHVNIYYSGDYITGYEITYTLWNDCWWAVGSMVFVTVYMWIHIGIPTSGLWTFVSSFFFSVSCILIIFASIPVAYVVSPSSKTTIASFLSLFLMAGIGSDTIFVFVDFWKQSRELKDPINRLMFTMMHAGKSCLATSLTTSISFFANLASVLQPLREFGLFMGMCVISAFALVLLFLPPMLVIRERILSPPPSFKVHDIATAEEAGLESLAISGRRGTCSCCRSRRKSKDSHSAISVLMSKLVGWIARCPLVVVVVTVLLMITFIAGVVMEAKLEEGVPEVFPPDHNQVVGQDIIGGFANLPEPSTAEYQSGTGGRHGCEVVQVGDFTDGSGTWEPPCRIHWCDASRDRVSQDRRLGVCYSSSITALAVSPTGALSSSQLSMAEGREQCNSLGMSVRFVMDSKPDQTEAHKIQEELFMALANETGTPGSLQDGEGGRPLMLEHWETGTVSLGKFWQTATGIVILPGVKSCSVNVMCFFGTRQCHNHEWEWLGQYNLPETNLQDGRLLSETTELSRSTANTQQVVALDAAQQSLGAPSLWSAGHPRALTTSTGVVRNPFDVTVVFGIRSPRTTPLAGKQEEMWSYDPDFDPSNPWAQRAMLAVCENLPRDLLVISRAMDVGRRPRCWIADFKRHLEDGHPEGPRRFPSREFDKDIADWYLRSTPVNKITGQSYTWFENQRIPMKACTMQFYVNVDSTIAATRALEYKKKWDDYIDDLNDKASISANSAWHTASVWVRAEAEQAIITSTVDTIVIACVSAWFGMLIFTGDPVLAMQVTAVVIIIILGLAFFMTCIMGWEIGAIEVISLVVFVGYSVTYSLHIAHNYSEARPLDPKFKSMVGTLVRKHGGSWSGVEQSGAEGAAGSSATPGEFRLTASGYREVCTRMSVLHVGGAVTSSATSTVGSAMFLLFCTLNIFLKLGLVVMAVTLLSIFFAVVGLPAILVRFGPGEDPCYRRRFRQVFQRVPGFKQFAQDRQAEEREAGGIVGTAHEPLVASPVLEVLS
jgi:predicted RND superfamily exporter protein